MPDTVTAAQPAPPVKSSPGAQDLPFVRIDGVTKKFGTFTAVDNVSIDIAKGEIFSLLGGSGCGKTTLLRMLAGFEDPTAGKVWIDGQDMTTVPAYSRPINMMFQSYALFPHMTVEKNIGYGLKHDHMTKAERHDRVREMLDLVQMSELGLRKPHQISGGQRQRVALARALARQPKLLLLDEPLAALDKKLREHTQFELMNIQEQTGVTFIVVTHDQEEAMTLSSRMAVMDKGRIMQIGTANDIYEYPGNKFVAGFIGSINFFNGTVTAIDGDHALVDVPELGGAMRAMRHPALGQGAAVTLAVRPEKLQIRRSKPDAGATVNVVAGRVQDLAYFGKDSLYRVALPDGRVLSVNSVNSRRGGEGTRDADWEDAVWLSFDASSALLFEA
jgi:putrescine transport system ATP-binding protein